MPLRASRSRWRPDDGGDMAAATWSLSASIKKGDEHEIYSCTPSEKKKSHYIILPKPNKY